MNDMLLLHLLKDGVEDVSILVTKVDVNFSGSVVDSKIDRRTWYVLPSLIHVVLIHFLIVPNLDGFVLIESMILLLHEGGITELPCF